MEGQGPGTPLGSLPRCRQGEQGLQRFWALGTRLEPGARRAGQLPAPVREM